VETAETFLNSAEVNGPGFVAGIPDFDRTTFESERQLWLAPGGLDGLRVSYRLFYFEPVDKTAIYIQVHSGSSVVECRKMSGWGDFFPLDISSLSNTGAAWLQNLTFTGVYAKIEELANQGNCKIAVTYNSSFHYPEKVFYQSCGASVESFYLYMDILVP